MFGDVSCGLMELKPNCLDMMINGIFGGKRRKLQASEHHPDHEVCGGSILLGGCSSAAGTGELHRTDGIMGKEDDVDI